jgi:SAM-dependent methyltransferase
MVDYYEDGSLSAALYDLIEGVSRPAAPEIAFYRRLAGPRPLAILEVGCGTGRVAWPLAEDGHRVLGVDLSPAMLAQAERKAVDHGADVRSRVSFVSGDMRDLALGRRFDLILLPYRVFNHLLTEEDQERCLAALRVHVEPHGRVILDTAHPTYEELGAPERKRPSILCLRLPDQGLVVDFETRWADIDLLEQTFTVAARYAVSTTDGRLLRESAEPLHVRWINPPEMRRLVRLHGFAILDERQSFDDDRPPQRHGDRLWVLEPV